METIVSVVGGVAHALAIFGGVLSAVFIAYSGILWMTSSGDPQKMAQARSSLICSVVGLVIVGVAFLIPSVVSEAVIEPVGGVSVEDLVGFDCDGLLRQHFVSRRWANNPERMQRLVSRVQSEQDGCSSDLWNPVVRTADGHPGCFDTKDGGQFLGDARVPSSLMNGGSPPSSSRRDSRNNVVVYFNTDNFPSDGSYCWMYVSDLGVWSDSSKSGSS